MECNKEEAIRAKEMAEDLMKKMDFSGARRLALKAQKLYNDLDNISQMLMVCDVHCAAGVRFGNEMNWYGILQIDKTANDVTIKKQYRKFALLLHPDKNKFPGAESAFKLIGEAQRMVLDKVSVSRPAPAPSYRPQQKPNYHTYTWGSKNHNVRNSFTGWRPENQCPQQQAQAQPSVSRDRPTFWTLCPFCAEKYEFYRDVINKFVYCQKCGKQFSAYEISSAQSATPATNSSQAAFAFRQQRKIPNQNACSADPRYQKNSSGNNPRKQSIPVTGCSSKVCPENVVGTENVGGKRKRKKVESSESSESESSSESEVDIVVDENGNIKAGQDLGSDGGQQPRRSGRSKRQVSYKENLSDDEESVNHPERSTENGDAKREETSKIREQLDLDNHSEETLPNGTRNEKMKSKEKVEACVSNRNSEACADIQKNREVHDSKSDSTLEAASEPEFYDCPDPDFSDFDKLREEGLFKAGQTWAIYDTADGMPRFYAQIKKVFTPGFKLRITWFEPDPDDENEILWFEENLPVSCGKFKTGVSENTKDHLMFSHLIDCEKGSRRGTYKVFPKKGETWALFKNWEINWFSDPDSHRKFDYEFVEIMSEYADGAGLSVAYLYKVKGFSSVFCRMVKDGLDTFQISPGELFRLAHNVPSFKLTGKERKGVPKGSYELDPACLPPKVEEIAAPLDLMVDPIEIPEPEFYNFNADKSVEKFQIGQIWSLYSDEEGLPRYYVQIQKIECKQEFKLHINWLEPRPLPDHVTQWCDKEIPIPCGTFKVKKGGSEIYSDLKKFSHQLRVERVEKRNEYTIFPKSGDVWALYRNWSNELKFSDLENCEFDIVDVLDGSNTNIEVLVLERVDSFTSVFKASMKEGSLVKMVIPGSELLRFSHQIPAFRLTEERGGSLRGFLELDPAALSVSYFCT